MDEGRHPRSREPWTRRLQITILGSVALKVIHDVHNPVIVVQICKVAIRPSRSRSIASCFRRTAPNSAIASSITPSIVGEPKPQLHLLRVLESPGWGASAFDAGLVSQYIEASREMSEQHLEALGGKLKEHGYEVSSELRDGGAADQILDCAKSCGADMIAMATHGRGGIGRLILGSVANRVLQHTTVPLLLIHPSVEK
ncbi:MAG: universal stress protein [Thermomicrobiales bacterium]